MPYNVREVLGTDHPVLTAVLLGVVLLGSGIAPVALAGVWRRWPRAFAVLALPTAILAGLIIFFALWSAVPAESLDDILGTPLWYRDLHAVETPADVAAASAESGATVASRAWWDNPSTVDTFERAARFIGLFFAPLACWTLAARLVAGRLGWNMLFGLVPTVIMGWLSYEAVVVYTRTDNIVELLRGGGNLTCVVCVAASLLLTGLAAAGIARSLARGPRRHGRLLVAALLLAAASLPAGWLFLVGATSPKLEKYGQVFTARQFLFSPDREHYLADGAIAARYAAAHAGGLAVLSLGMLLAYGVGRWLPQPKTRPSSGHGTQQSGAAIPGGGSLKITAPRAGHLALLAWAYAMFVVYGSLVPLHYRAVDLVTAWAQFQQIQWIDIRLNGRADMVANFLLFIPLSFLWLGSLCVDRVFWTKAVAVVFLLPFCLAFGLGVEFIQVWFPPRTVSMNDVVAQSAGVIVGCIAWLAFGQRLVNWVRQFTQETRPLARLEWLLHFYLLGLIIYSVLPLDLTLSPAELYRKIEAGRVVLVPFTYAYASTYQLVVRYALDTLVFVPVGALMAVVLTGQQRPLRPVLQATMLTGAIAVAIEAAQFLVYSRFVDTTDIVLSLLGGALGAWLMGRWIGAEAMAARRDNRLRARWRRAAIWIALASAYGVVLMAGYWYPYHLTHDRQAIRTRLYGFFHSVPLAPLHSGSEFNAISQVLLRILSYAIFSGLLMAAAGHIASTRYALRWLAAGVMLIGTTLALGIELVQVAMPTHSADLTEVLICSAGVALGIFVVAKVGVGTAAGSEIRGSGSEA